MKKSNGYARGKTVLKNQKPPTDINNCPCCDGLRWNCLCHCHFKKLDAPLPDSEVREVTTRWKLKDNEGKPFYWDHTVKYSFTP